MGILKNSKHEQFCHLVATGSAAYQAYIDVGYSPKGARGHASRLVAKGTIASRIEEMKANVRKSVELEVGISISWVIDGIKETIKKATEAGQHAAALKGFELLGKELGMYQGRDKEGNRGDPNMTVIVFERPIKPEIQPYTDIASTEIEAPEAV